MVCSKGHQEIDWLCRQRYYWWCHWDHVTLMLASMESHDQKGNVAPHFVIVTDNAINILWCWCYCQWCHMAKKSCCTSFQSSLPKEYNYAIDDAGANSVTWPKSNESHDSPHFDNLDLRILMVPLMMASVLCDTNFSTNGITWSKKSCCTSF